MNDVEICQYNLTDKKGHINGKLAILRGGLQSENPVAYMNEAVSEYVGHELHNQFIEIHMDTPWVRVIVSEINELDYEPFVSQRL